MPTDRHFRKHNILELEVEEMKLENGIKSRGWGGSATDELKEESPSTSNSFPLDPGVKSASASPVKKELSTQSSMSSLEKREEVVGGEITVKVEPGQPLKLARSTSRRIVAEPPTLFNDYPDKAEEAQADFEMIPSCIYSNKYIGSTEHGSMDCDCLEEWDAINSLNAACGPDSDCINRATKMECVGDCNCGTECRNQRFQQQTYAPVTIFKTEKKGYGLRADTDLNPDDFIYEYIGEVIDEVKFRRRMMQYDEEGIKHFYFMSLTKGEFVDATKKGNLGRFCNHSCNPNCYVDKWVVGEKLRMGIFAERKIRAGEELVFNYNVDRYGANPQPCYCGEPNCTGYIGGKTQTERATKLSHTIIEALGIGDGDAWDTAVAKKPRKKKAGDDDEEYVNNVQPKSLDENGVTKVMATLMQCKEKWIAVKLLGRIQRCDDERVRNRVVKMHGYQILNSTLTMWKEDANVVLQIFDILDKFPRLTRNKISDSKIEITVEGLRSNEDGRVASQAESLLREWSTLEVAYRIPRKKREVDATDTPEKSSRLAPRGSRDERKPRSRSRSRGESRSSSKSMETPRGPAAPSGPRNNFTPRGPGFYAGSRPPFRQRAFNALPSGWFSAQDEAGRTYYYDMTGKTTWERPTAASAPPPPPPKPTSNNKALEDIINEITNAKANLPKEKLTTVAASQVVNGESKRDITAGKEKWRTLPEEKQKKLYENTLFPHVKYVMDKFKGKLPKDDLKRFAKEISKKLVNSDFKNNRVEDPTKISSRKEKQVKAYVKEYFDKAAKKHKEREQRRAERKVKQANAPEFSASAVAAEIKKEEEEEEEEEEESEGDQDTPMFEDGHDDKPKKESTTPGTPVDPLLTADTLKRKREFIDEVKREDPESTPSKVLKSETPPPHPPPPPPPPPPAPTNDFYPCPTSGLHNDEDEDERGHHGTEINPASRMDIQSDNIETAPGTPPGQHHGPLLTTPNS
ncbi:MAG: hypothetical protein Q9163_004424 [Psora crenata]